MAWWYVWSIHPFEEAHQYDTIDFIGPNPPMQRVNAFRLSKSIKEINHILPFNLLKSLRLVKFYEMLQIVDSGNAIGFSRANFSLHGQNVINNRLTVFS